MRYRSHSTRAQGPTWGDPKRLAGSVPNCEPPKPRVTGPPLLSHGQASGVDRWPGGTDTQMSTSSLGPAGSGTVSLVTSQRFWTVPEAAPQPVGRTGLHFGATAEFSGYFCPAPAGGTPQRGGGPGSAEPQRPIGAPLLRSCCRPSHQTGCQERRLLGAQEARGPGAQGHRGAETGTNASQVPGPIAARPAARRPRGWDRGARSFPASHPLPRLPCM